MNGTTLTDLGVVKLDFSKNNVQQEFMRCNVPYQCFSGGFGSGKTTACCAKGLFLSAAIPGNLGVVCRNTYPDLRDSTRKVFLEITPPDWVKQWKEAENRLIFKNNSEVLFRHFEEGKVKVGPNLGWFFVDQAEEATVEIFRGLMGRLRRAVPRRYGLLAMNPNGEDWQVQMFRKAGNPRFRLFDSTTFDNKDNLPEGYIQDLLDNYPADWLDRFVWGKWTTMSGLIFHEFDDVENMVDPFRIPRSWVRGRGLDWGVDAPTTCVWASVEPGGERTRRFYLYDCYGDREKTPAEHAAAILEKSHGDAGVMASVLDAAAFSRDSNMKSPADKFRDAGILCLPATRDLLGSIMLVKHLFKTRRLLLVRGKTESIVEELKKWKWGPKRSGTEKPAVGSDHYLDPVRYILDFFDKRQLYLPAERSEKDRAEGKLTIGPGKGAADPVTGLPA